jgi:hypothetical protein
LPPNLKRPIISRSLLLVSGRSYLAFYSTTVRFVHALPIYHDCNRLYQYPHTLALSENREIGLNFQVL